MESESVRTFLGAVHDRIAECLISIIKEWTLAGTAILTTAGQHIKV
jgi:hypothetical protein